LGAAAYPDGARLEAQGQGLKALVSAAVVRFCSVAVERKNQIYKIDQIDRMGQTDEIDQINLIDRINHLNDLNQINPST
jgi:hypothetical protein